MMIGMIKDRKSYCDFLANELRDMKKKIGEAVDRGNDLSAEDREEISENISSHLNEISEVIDSKLQAIARNCIEWEQGKSRRTEEGRSEKVHPEGVPYSSTPI
jgi:hypothetical protein